MNNTNYTDFCINGQCFPLMADSHILPPMDSLYYGLRLCIHGILGTSGVLLNVVCIFLLLKTKLVKQWTYGMILNFCLSDLVFLTNIVVMFLPGVITERWVRLRDV